MDLIMSDFKMSIETVKIQPDTKPCVLARCSDTEPIFHEQNERNERNEQNERNERNERNDMNGYVLFPREPPPFTTLQYTTDADLRPKSQPPHIDSILPKPILYSSISIGSYEWDGTYPIGLMQEKT